MGPFWHVGPDQDHVPISGPTPNMVEKIRPTLVSLYSVAHTSSNFSLWQCTLGDLSTSTLMRYEIRLVELRKNIIRGNCRKLHNTPSSDHTLHYWVSQAGWKRRTLSPACDCPHLVAGFLALLLLWRLWLQQRNDPNNLLLNCSCVKIFLFPHLDPIDQPLLLLLLLVAGGGAHPLIGHQVAGLANLDHNHQVMWGEYLLSTS